MSKEGKYRVIIDTNLLLSFLIGKRLHDLLDIISHSEVQLVMSPFLFDEIFEVASRPKFARYFRPVRLKSASVGAGPVPARLPDRANVAGDNGKCM